MNVSFIGCPCSGKTTTAAMVFAKLKETGIPVEFVPEFARIYIARKRIAEGLAPDAPLVLTDSDQLHIMEGQIELETTITKSCGPSVTVISDTSALSALLYMSEEARQQATVARMIQQALAVSGLVFYAEPVFNWNQTLDPNRVHNQDQSLKIDREILPVLKKYTPDGFAVFPLTASADQRAATVMAEIYHQLLGSYRVP